MLQFYLFFFSFCIQERERVQKKNPIRIVYAL